MILVKIFGFIRHDEEQRASLHTKQVWKKKKQREELRDLAKKERKDNLKKERRPTFYIYDFSVGLNLV